MWCVDYVVCGVLFEWWRGGARGGARYTHASCHHPYATVADVSSIVTVATIFAGFAVSATAVTPSVIPVLHTLEAPDALVPTLYTNPYGVHKVPNILVPRHYGKMVGLSEAAALMQPRSLRGVTTQEHVEVHRLT